MVKFTPIPCTGFVVSKMTASAGDTFTFELPASHTQENLKNFVAHVEGMAQVRRTGHPLVDFKQAGDTTNTAGWANPKPGIMIFKVLSETYSYYCIQREDGAPSLARDVRLVAGSNDVLKAGHHGLVVMGVAEVDGVEFIPFSQILPSTIDREITGLSADTLVLEFPE